MPKQEKKNGTPRTQARDLIKKVIRRVKRRGAEPGAGELEADTGAASPEPERELDPKKRRR